MQVTKCDICKKQIKERNRSFYLRTGGFISFEFCQKCSQPLKEFLENKKLIEQPHAKK